VVATVRLKRASSVHVGLPWRGLFPIDSVTIGSGATVSDEAAQFLARIADPLFERTNRYIALIDALVAAGVWAKLDFLYVFAADNINTARTNLKSSTYHATAVNSPTFTADRGFAGDGLASYVDTNFSPLNATDPAYTQDAAHIGVWSLTQGQDTSARAFGWLDGIDGATLQPRTGANVVSVRINQASPDLNGANTDGRGFYLANRSSAAAIQTYRNGASVDTGTNPSTGLNAESFKTHYTSVGVYSVVQVAAAWAGGSLSAAEVSAFYTAMLVYMQGVGASA
jgi:hypothetical protein